MNKYIISSCLLYLLFACTPWINAREESGTLPEIYGKPINLNPDMLFDSPFISSKHGSGLVIIEKGYRKLKIDMGF